MERARCYNHEVVLGVIGVPAKDEIYYAIKNDGSYMIKDNVTTSIYVDPKEENLVLFW